jgi:AcrR family transcriptional regulator
MLIPVNPRWRPIVYPLVMVRPRAREKESQVIAAATALFAARGYVAVTVADVAARAGVGLSTLYLRFPSKEALGNAVLRHCKSAWARATLDDWPAAATPAEQFQTYWTRLHAFARTNAAEATYAERRPVAHTLDDETEALIADLHRRSTVIIRHWVGAGGLQVDVAGALIHGTFWGVYALPVPPRRRAVLLRQASHAVWHCLSAELPEQARR